MTLLPPPPHNGSSVDAAGVNGIKEMLLRSAGGAAAFIQAFFCSGCRLIRAPRHTRWLSGPFGGINGNVGVNMTLRAGGLPFLTNSGLSFAAIFGPVVLGGGFVNNPRGRLRILSSPPPLPETKTYRRSRELFTKGFDSAAGRHQSVPPRTSAPFLTFFLSLHHREQREAELAYFASLEQGWASRATLTFKI